MNILLSLGGLLVVAALGSPCCLPETLSFDFSLKVNITSQVEDNPPMNFQSGLSGRGAYDFNQQYFYVKFTMRDQGAELFLDLRKGDVFDWLQRGNESYCTKRGLTGILGKDWRCVLDNTNIFNPISGNQNYQLDIANLASGVVSMQQDNSCHPLGAEARIDTSGPYSTSIVQARLSVSNTEEKFDGSIFQAPCTPDPAPPIGYRPEIPTPDELIQTLIRSKQPRNNN